jgi:transcriptional regulator with XRE-family HTH domain
MIHEQRGEETAISEVREFGERLREVRRAQEVTQEELADYSGLSRVSVIKIEGGGDLRLSNLLRLAGLLGLEVVVRPRGIR